MCFFWSNYSGLREGGKHSADSDACIQFAVDPCVWVCGILGMCATALSTCLLRTIISLPFRIVCSHKEPCRKPKTQPWNTFLKIVVVFFTSRCLKKKKFYRIIKKLERKKNFCFNHWLTHSKKSVMWRTLKTRLLASGRASQPKPNQDSFAAFVSQRNEFDKTSRKSVNVPRGDRWRALPILQDNTREDKQLVCLLGQFYVSPFECDNVKDTF